MTQGSPKYVSTPGDVDANPHLLEVRPGPFKEQMTLIHYGSAGGYRDSFRLSARSARELAAWLLTVAATLDTD